MALIGARCDDHDSPPVLGFREVVDCCLQSPDQWAATARHEVFEAFAKRLRVDQAERQHEAGVAAPIIAGEGNAASNDTKGDLRTTLTLH